MPLRSLFQQAAIHRSVLLNPVLFLLFLLQVGFESAVAQNPFALREIRSVEIAGDVRDAISILPYFNRNELLDAHILRVLASVQADTAIPAIQFLLASQNPGTRSAAAHAFGQTLRFSTRARDLEEAFFNLLSQEKDATVAAEMLDAFGRFASAPMLDRVAELHTDDAKISAAQAMCIARFAVRSIRSRAGTDRAAAIASDPVDAGPSAVARSNAMFALVRIGDSTFLVPHTQLMMHSAQSSLPEVRMLAAALAGKIRTTEAGSLAFAMTEDPDWRVRVNAVRSVAAVVPNPSMRRQALRVLTQAMRGHDYQTSKAVLQAIAALPVGDQPMMMALKKMIDTSRSEDLRDDAILALASVFPDFGLIVLRGWRGKAEPPISVLRSLGTIAKKQHQCEQFVIDWLKEFIASSDARRASAALESWVACWRLLRPLPRSSKDSAANLVFRTGSLDALRRHSETPGHSAAVQVLAEALSDSVFASKECVTPLLESLKKFSSTDNVETVLSLLEAVGKLADSAMVQPLRTYLNDGNSAVRIAAASALRRCGIDATASETKPARVEHDWHMLVSFRRNPTAVVGTNRGTFRFELLYQEAPFTVESFISLARKKFYDGLTFHRVVPNFVVQGGDPSGDGTGGPPYTIRSEFSRRSFVRGAVGIASAGKDTEGSQFFIMHSAAAHLDGRYTQFGTVTEGMDVIDRLEVGDRILSVKIDE